MSSEVLRDKSGHKLGTIETNGSRQVIRDASGHKLGEFDGKVTRDASGHKIGDGNLFTMLLNK